MSDCLTENPRIFYIVGSVSLQLYNMKTTINLFFPFVYEPFHSSNFTYLIKIIESKIPFRVCYKINDSGILYLTLPVVVWTSHLRGETYGPFCYYIQQRFELRDYRYPYYSTVLSFYFHYGELVL